MKIAKSQLVVLLAVLIAFAAVLLASSRQTPENLTSATSDEETTQGIAIENRDAPRSVASRDFLAGPGRAAIPEPAAALLRSLGTTLSATTVGALELEIDIRFTDFLAGLDGSPQRIEDIRQALIAAYADILAFGVALQQGSITPAEAESRADPNYVLNQLAELLGPEEVIELETYLEADARRRFLTTYEPQLELISGQLSLENREALLETLFTETYLLENNNGIGAASNLESGFQRQLEAISNTRDSLRSTMTPEQFTQANAFLDEQEQGLLGAQTIFSPN